MKFRGNTRGLIRGLKKFVTSLQAADVKAADLAAANGKIPLLFGASEAVTTALETIRARCVAAMSQS